MADYVTGFELKLKIKDVEDRIEAHRYFEDFIIGLSEFVSSTDESDNHYEILGATSRYLIEEC